MDTVTLTGLAASALTATAAIPQLLKVLHTRRAGDISPLTVGALALGLALWTVYGFQRQDMIIVVANSLPCLVNIVILLLYFRYRC